MGDISRKGRGLLGVGKAKRPGGRSSPTRQPPKSKQEQRDEDYAALGRAVTGIKGKPHSTKKGRLSAAKNFLNRAWGQKYKKKKGVPV